MPTQSDQIDKLINETTALLGEVVNQKNRLTTASANSTVKAGEAATSAQNAKVEADKATTQQVEATKQAGIAKASADKATEVSGLDTVAEAVQVALADSYQYAMTKVDFDANRELNKEKYAGSGFVEWGKHSKSTDNVNNGISCFPTSILWLNQIMLGGGSNSIGNSKLPYPLCNVDGVNLHINTVSRSDVEGISGVKFPPAPDGTKSYDSATGIVTDHTIGAADHNAAVTAAFASETATNKVILTRQDLGFVEINPNAECTVFKPLGNKQYGATTFDGITLKKLTDLGIQQSESGFGVWDSETVGYGELISSLTDAQLKTVLSNPKNNIRFDPITNKLAQSEYKIRVEEGYNDTATLNERMTKLGYTQDKTDVTLWTHSDGRQAITLFLRQAYNSGAYHPEFNIFGCSRLLNKENTSNGLWHSATFGINSTKDCLTQYVYRVDDGYIGGFIGSANGSGRPTSDPVQFYDAVYACQIKDLRLSAHKQDVTKLRVDAMRQAVAGEMRGWGQVPFSFYAAGSDSNTVSSATSYFCIDAGLNQYIGKQQTYLYIIKADGRIFETDKFQSDIYGSDGKTFIKTGVNFERAPDDKFMVSFELTPQSDTLGWTDIVGSPENIAATFPNGCVGTWIPVTLPYTDFPLNTKASGTNSTITYTTTNGSSWASTTVSIDTVKNTCGSALNANEVRLIHYPTLSNFTQPANNSVVVGEVGDVYTNQHFDISEGNRWQYSLTETIAKTSGGIRYADMSCIDKTLTRGNHANTGKMLSASHSPLSLTATQNNSPAVKALSTITEKDGLLYLQLHGSELHYDATAGNWGDNSTIPIINGEGTRTDDNGHVVKTFCHHSMIPLGIASYSDSSQAK